MSWSKAAGPVTGYKVYCYPSESREAEITKDIWELTREHVVIDGLKPNCTYRVGMASVTEDVNSKLVFTKDQITMRKICP